MILVVTIFSNTLPVLDKRLIGRYSVGPLGLGFLGTGDITAYFQIRGRFPDDQLVLIILEGHPLVY